MENRAHARRLEMDSLRSRFPQLALRIYLNAASEGPMPEEAIREAERVARLKASPWEIGSDCYYIEPAAVRTRIENLIGAPSGTVALVAGTSAGIGIAARGLRVSPGDEILLLEAQFPSNVNPWQAAVMRGATLRVAPRPLGSDPSDAVLAAIGPATRVVAIDWVNFVDGAVADLARIGSACHDRGIRFVVDAAQGAGALALHLSDLPVDILAAPSHKWLLGPVGAGFVYVAPALRDELQPWNAGWVNLAARAGFRNLMQLSHRPPADATRFETGSPPYGLLIPWNVSLEMLSALGAPAVESCILGLAARLARGIAALAPAAHATRGLKLVTPAPSGPPRSGIVSFTADEDRTVSLYRRLMAAGTVIALREGVIRVSPHVYNTDAEIDALLDSCRQFLG